MEWTFIQLSIFREYQWIRTDSAEQKILIFFWVNCSLKTDYVGAVRSFDYLTGNAHAITLMQALKRNYNRIPNLHSIVPQFVFEIFTHAGEIIKLFDAWEKVVVEYIFEIWVLQINQTCRGTNASHLKYRNSISGSSILFRTHIWRFLIFVRL